MFGTKKTLLQIIILAIRTKKTIVPHAYWQLYVHQLCNFLKLKMLDRNKEYYLVAIDSCQCVHFGLNLKKWNHL